jgi:hypothetical protein
VPVAIALIGAAATIVAALISVRAGSDDDDVSVGTTTVTTPTTTAPDDGTTTSSFTPFRDLDPRVFLNRDSGPAGTTVLVSGSDFEPGERIVLRFHTEQLGTTTADGSGGFANVAVVIPDTFSVFAPQQFSISASGESSLARAEAPFTITG